MKRAILVCVLVALVGGSVVAQLNQPENEAELGVGFTASIFASYASAVLNVVHKPQLFGVGAGGKLMVGLGQRDFYAATYGRIELGPLYLGLGPLFLIRQPPEDEFVNTSELISLFSTLGLGLPLDSIANGNLVLDVGVDASLTPSPILVSDTGDIIGDFFASLIATTIGAIFNTVKVNLGLAYAAGF